MKFSIIMPAYNCEKYISEAVKSVLAQTERDFELIIVDDGSLDATLEVCVELAYGRDNVHIHSISHGGVSTARNVGLGKALGDYILFIDSDDSWEKDFLQNIADVLKPEDDLLIVGARIDYYLSDGSFQYSRNEFVNQNNAVQIVQDDCVDEFLSSYNIAAPWNKVYKRAVIDRNSLAFCETCVYLEDLKFNLDYLQYASEIKVLHKNLYRYRLFSDKSQILKRNFGEAFVNADELYTSAIAFVESRGKELKDCDVVVGLLLTAYVNEFLCQIRDKNKKTQKLILEAMVSNSCFKILVKLSKGKFYKLFNVLSMLRMRFLQIEVLKKYMCKKEIV